MQRRWHPDKFMSKIHSDSDKTVATPEEFELIEYIGTGAGR